MRKDRKLAPLRSHSSLILSCILCKALHTVNIDLRNQQEVVFFFFFNKELNFNQLNFSRVTHAFQVNLILGLNDLSVYPFVVSSCCDGSRWSLGLGSHALGNRLPLSVSWLSSSRLRNRIEQSDGLSLLRLSYKEASFHLGCSCSLPLGWRGLGRGQLPCWEAHMT